MGALASFFLPSPPRTAEADASPGLRWLADLPGMAAHQLRQFGLTQIYNCGLCTFARPELFFSYRRGDRHKFIVTFIWRQPATSRQALTGRDGSVSSPQEQVFSGRAPCAS